MALLAEEIVEEWLNRNGFFTIRGAKIGVDEIDILAIRFLENGEIEYRHIEVQASMRPVSYISRVPKNVQKMGKAPNSASRSHSELVEGVEEWIDKKFKKSKKTDLIRQLAPSKWSSELVINNVKSDEEVELIRGHGIKIIQLRDIISELQHNKFKVEKAVGSDFVDLVNMGATISIDKN